jgi:sulfur-oxidizing protein SoxZ
MAKSIRLRANTKGDVVEVKALLTHPMETGLRKDKKTGKKVPAHFIQEVNCTHNGKAVMTAEWGGAVSKNPYLSFKFGAGKAGDTVGIAWTDNTGAKDSVETKVK